MSNNEDSDRNSDDENDLDDLEELLEKMDIDKDYNMWSTFRSSMEAGTTEIVLSDDGAVDVQPDDITVDKSAGGDEASASSSDHQWHQRLQREEIYSSKYRPTVQEEAELREVELLLGVTTAKGRFPILFRSNSAQQMSEAEKSSWMSVARPPNQHPSLVLKRGPCLLQTPGQNSNGSMECELILLTRGLVIATAMNNTEKHIVSRQFYKAIAWSDVEFVQPDVNEPMGFAVHLLNDDESFEFLCVERQAWLHAVEIVLIHHQERCNPRTDLGWQYQLVYHAGFTMAVTNRTDLDNALTKDVLNRIDKYNGYAPLHYAVKYNHVPAISVLLEAGADPDIADADGHTSMYWCIRDKLPETTVALLEEHGATKRKDLEKRDSELFGKVAATEAIMEEKRREEQQKKEAEEAAAEMKNNMKLLQQRGEKIDELGNKAADLNQGAQDFASMAKQLKEASKKKRWYQL